MPGSKHPRLISAAKIAVAVAVLSYVIGNILIAPPTLKDSSDVLHKAKAINLPGTHGPESIDFDPNGGGPYTGVMDGRVLKWEGDSIGWTEFAVTSSDRQDCEAETWYPAKEDRCGRPLGIHFEEKSGDLYIADCYRGIFKVGPQGGLATQVVSEAEGQPFHFTNDLDIDEDEDVIYFTDSSDTYHIRTLMHLFLNSDRTGRFIKYEKSTKKATVLMKGLFFPNGVALSKDKSFVVIAEAATSIVYRYWLRGPKAGTHDIFAKLPGFLDNIRRNDKGEFWVAVNCKRGIFQGYAVSHPWVLKVMSKLPVNSRFIYKSLNGFKSHGVAVKLSEEGEIVQILEDSNGNIMRGISEIHEKNGKLWMGSITEPYVGVYDLN